MDSVNDSVTNHTGFPHSEIAGYNGSYHLTDAYRRLARPSSPLTAGHPPCTLSRLTSQPEDVSFDSSSCCENLRDSRTTFVVQCFNFQLDPDFKEQNFAVNLCRYTLKYFYLITTEMVELCGIEPQTSCVQSRRSPS